MRLISVELHGFRRFRNKTKMQLDGKLIAIIGSNEAGKSSFLEALQRLNNYNKFIISGGEQELTRGGSYPDNHLVISATFLVDDEDRKAISHLDDTAKIRYFKWEKKVSGGFLMTATPVPERKFHRRQSVVAELRKFSPKLEKLSKTQNLSEETETSIEELIANKTIDNLCKLLETEDDKLTQITLNEISKFIESINDDEIESNIQITASIIEKLNAIKDNEATTTHYSASSILSKRIPNFLLFSEEERNLRSSYSFEELENEVPKSLNNLLKVAKLDLTKLIGFIKENDVGQKEQLLETVNLGLKEFFLNIWKQSKVWVRLSADESRLNVLVKEKGAVSYVNIAERSDGLRQFVALLTFLNLENYDELPILLIDEAETHLHYDAQADLIQMLARQNITSQVIYTTHSMGCLPEDLGNGVRLIKQVNENSEIQNWFWDSDETGFSPILFGMGARNLAFFPIRYAVVVEGPSDIIILPRLLREATGKDFLGFQIVPGISQATKDTISILDKHGHRTVYLTDADAGGKALQTALQSAGIPKSKIFQLPDSKKLGLVLEDFIDIDVYVNAVNEEIRRKYGDKYKILKSDINVPNRPEALKQWFKKKRLRDFGKRRVAYQVTENDIDKPILNPRMKKGLEKLYQNTVNELSKEN
jgi:predicted ATP-dependent endonuclease of OLD family